MDAVFLIETFADGFFAAELVAEDGTSVGEEKVNYKMLKIKKTW